MAPDPARDARGILVSIAVPWAPQISPFCCRRSAKLESHDNRRVPMGLREKINDALKEAMKAKDARRVSTLRMVNAALKDRDIANRSEDSRALIGDDEVLMLLAKM